MQRTVRRLLVVSATLVLAVSMQGCLFGISNSVRLSAFPKHGATHATTRLVYGLDTSNGPLTMALVRYDEATGDAGNCSHSDEAVASSTDPGITYFVFEVPPGTYIATGSGYPAGSAQSAFVVPSGKAVYVGDFSNSTEPAFGFESPHQLLLDRAKLETAKAKLGSGSETLALAEARPVGRVNAKLCTP